MVKFCNSEARQAGGFCRNRVALYAMEKQLKREPQSIENLSSLTLTP